MNSDYSTPGIEDAAKLFNTELKAHDNTLRSIFIQSENAAIKESENSFKEMRERGDLVGIVELEVVYLDLKMSHNQDISVSEGEPHAIDGVEKTRVNKGLVDGRTAIELAWRIDSYDKYSEYLMFANNVVVDRDGLPKDGFRVFIYNQCKALQNNMGAELIDSAKSRNKERIKNLHVAEDMYISKQREHMNRFSQEHPGHALSLKYLSKQKSIEPER